jgi:hypothetical protein
LLFGAAIGDTGQELEPSGRKMAFAGGQEQRLICMLNRRVALGASQPADNDIRFDNTAREE